MNVVGRYRVERRLGAGAFSTVWLAHDPALDIPVAVKVLSENWIDNAETRTRFLDEARMLRRISDPRIVGVHDIGTLPDGRDYFVMDYAEGGTLADLCHAPVLPSAALRLGAELARGVAVLHRNGVLHRDLKPANVLLTGAEQPAVLIADLGMAKRLAEASGLTVAAGTPAYMAPEQARGLDLDERTDVYGVAAVCYRMLSGEEPFPDETLDMIASRPPDRAPAPLQPSDDLPAGVQAVLATALAADPHRRPASATVLAEQLEAFIKGESTTARPVGTVGARPAPAPGAGLRVALLGILTAAVTWLVLSLLVAR